MKWIQAKQICYYWLAQYDNYISSWNEEHLFRFRNKSGHLLANQIRGKRHVIHVICLKDEHGQLQYNPKVIAEHFKQYYTKIYTTFSNPQDSDVFLE